jgi:hypothetical protein
MTEDNRRDMNVAKVARLQFHINESISKLNELGLSKDADLLLSVFEKIKIGVSESIENLPVQEINRKTEQMDQDFDTMTIIILKLQDIERNQVRLEEKIDSNKQDTDEKLEQYKQDHTERIEKEREENKRLRKEDKREFKQKLDGIEQDIRNLTVQNNNQDERHNHHDAMALEIFKQINELDGRLTLRIDQLEFAVKSIVDRTREIAQRIEPNSLIANPLDGEEESILKVISKYIIMSIYERLSNSVNNNWFNNFGFRDNYIVS